MTGQCSVLVSSTIRFNGDLPNQDETERSFIGKTENFSNMQKMFEKKINNDSNHNKSKNKNNTNIIKPNTCNTNNDTTYYVLRTTYYVTLPPTFDNSNNVVVVVVDDGDDVDDDDNENKRHVHSTYSCCPRKSRPSALPTDRISSRKLEAHRLRSGSGVLLRLFFLVFVFVSTLFSALFYYVKSVTTNAYSTALSGYNNLSGQSFEDCIQMFGVFVIFKECSGFDVFVLCHLASTRPP